MADFSRAVSSMAIAIVREAASRISSRGNLAIVKQIDIGRRRKVPCRISFLYGVHEYGEPCTCVYIRVISESERVGVTRGLLARELPPERPPCRRWNQGSRPGTGDSGLSDADNRFSKLFRTRIETLGARKFISIRGSDGIV